MAHSTDVGRYCPFSQRLDAAIGKDCRTDIFAPGAPVTSSGILNDHASSVESGTSQATPVISGVILLMQQYHLRVTGRLPSIDDIERWLQVGGVAKKDGDGEDDNVLHTGVSFIRIDAQGAMSAMSQDLKVQMLAQQLSAKQLKLDPESKTQSATKAVDQLR